MIPQSAFMVCATIREDRVEELRELLASMNGSPGVTDPGNSLVPFGRFTRLHMARFLILETQISEDLEVYGRQPRPWPPTLVFLGDCDGPWSDMLAEFSSDAGPGLKTIFGHCRDFDANNDDLLDWMKKHNVRPAANYINWVGRTVEQVHEEAALHEALKKRLDSITVTDEPREPQALYRDLRDFVRKEVSQGSLTLKPIPPTPLGWRLGNWLHMIGIPVVLLILAPLVIVLLPFYALRLRVLERSDPEITPRPDPDHVARLSGLEDQLVTNQFSAFGDVKPGLFRRYTVLFLLMMLNYSARHIYNKGYLTRVQTIHFARWVVLDDKRRLLFASNYDGSLESYMDDFINKVAWGLNLVFSNGVGYPRTRWLIKDGAEQEQKFKYYLRRHQVYTDVWYKAYPDATAYDLARNTRIRRGLEQKPPRNDREARAWLSLI